jgi:hypothetical protein
MQTRASSRDLMNAQIASQTQRRGLLAILAILVLLPFSEWRFASNTLVT